MSAPDAVDLAAGPLSEEHVTELAGVLARAEHTARCQCGYDQQVPSDVHYALAQAAARWLVGQLRVVVHGG